jgi:serpin B
LMERPGNLVFSPFSIYITLGMAFAGARGETAAQMIQALGFASSDEPLHDSFAHITTRLKMAGGGEYQMALANSLWGQAGAALQGEFLDLVDRYYGGGMNTVDFRGATDAARKTINRWGEDKTKQKIRNLIPPGGLDALTRLVLVNAIYFRGTWISKFDKADTGDEPFYLEDGGKVQVPLMYQHEEIPYYQADGYKVVSLAYRGGDLSMLVLLPDKKNGLQDLEAKLSARMLQDCATKTASREVDLFLPRFRMTWGTVDMGAPLSALGMPLAFTQFEADFSGINGYQPPHEESLSISAVYHKAFVEVNEKGTEAAAATATAMIDAAPMDWEPPPVAVFRADHPFLFAIRDWENGAILFLGRVADPTQED